MIAHSSTRAGVTVVEAIVALLLGLFLVQLGHATLLGLRDAQRTSAHRLDVLASSRIARSVLRRELARGVAGRDWIATPDSIRLRAFRGTGIICSRGPGAGEIVVAFRGDRGPAPVKDSVEVVRGDGSISYHDLVSARPSTGCTGAGPEDAVMVWRIATTLPDNPVLIRLFEVGSYHITGSALRYRSGAGGRQPLTPQVWQPGSGLFVGDSAVALRIDSRWGSVTRADSLFLAWVR